MTTSNNLMQKVLTTGGFGANGGLLAPAQSERFVDYMVNASVLMPQVRVKRMNRDVEDIDKINVGRRILRGASEAVDDGINVGVRFTKISLTSSKFRADWELSRDLLEDNLEGAALEGHIARLLTTQIGQDMEDLAINGDLDSADPLLHHLDGWQKRGEVDGHGIDYSGRDYTEDVLSQMLRAMPRKYMQRRQNLRFFAGSDIVQAHIDRVGELVAQANNFDPRAQLAEDEVLPANFGYSVMGKGGIRLQDVPMMLSEANADTVNTATESEDVGSIWLTDPQNLVWGIRREVEVMNEYKPKKDTIEYTVYTRVAAAVEEVGAFVVATNVGTTAAPANVTTTTPGA